jgi:hypothetical protein
MLVKLNPTVELYLKKQKLVGGGAPIQCFSFRAPPFGRKFSASTKFAK